MTVPSELREPCLVPDGDYSGLRGAGLLLSAVGETNECNAAKVVALNEIITDHEARVAAFNADKDGPL